MVGVFGSNVVVVNVVVEIELLLEELELLDELDELELELELVDDGAVDVVPGGLVVVGPAVVLVVDPPRSGGVSVYGGRSGLPQRQRVTG